MSLPGLREDGRYWKNEAGDEMRYVFQGGNLTYTLEFFEINENPPILQINLKIRDAQGQTTSWELDDYASRSIPGESLMTKINPCR